MEYKSLLLDGGCVSATAETIKHKSMDEYGKANGMTVVFAPWHPNPEYRISKTGSFLSRNENYKSGLVIIGEDGTPKQWRQE